jgi:hypothetical protein
MASLFNTGIELTTLRKHCRLAPNYLDEDENLKVYFLAAKGVVEKYIGYSLDASTAGIEYPIQLAILLLTAEYFAKREATTNIKLEKIPYSVETLLYPHRTKIMHI